MGWLVSRRQDNEELSDSVNLCYLFITTAKIQSYAYHMLVLSKFPRRERRIKTII